MKVIRINRKATATDYARAAAKMSDVISGDLNHAIGADIGSGAATGAALGTVVPGIGNVVGGIIGAAGGLVKGLTSSDIKAGKINKRDFYKLRDAFFVQAEKINKPVGSIPGDPFAQFSHSVIKDSPFKNYANELIAFQAMTKKYYPELQDNGTTKVIAPLKKTMDVAIRETGGMPNGSVTESTEQFVERVVAPATGKDYSGAGREAIANAAIEYISTLANKKREGESLPPTLDKIAGGAMKVEAGLERKVTQQVQGNIGAFVTNNPLLIFGVLALLLFAVMRRK